MSDTTSFALIVLLTAAIGLAAVLSSRIAERLRIPPPALVLATAAIAATVIPGVHSPPQQVVQRVVAIALLCILFDGGMHIGWSRFRAAAGPIVSVGVLGTFLTVAAGSVLIHFACGQNWYVALLVATAVSPTDPAVVFSVLGRRQIAGRSGTILEGESGANDPVGIALMASLITAGGLSAGAWLQVAGDFALQMAVGAAVGLVGGRALLWFMRHVHLPGDGLYPLRTLASALALYGVATVAHGSGFLAVFVAGIVLGDQRAPYKWEIDRFHSALASLAEIIAFVVLGLTVNLSQVARPDVWIPGLALAVLLVAVIRPLMVGLCLIPAHLPRNQRAFVLFAGLKGAVPILLGSFLLSAHLANAPRLYAIVIVVVAFSVVVQGSLIPTLARGLRLPMRTIEPEPWTLGVRLRDDPDGVHRLTVVAGSAAVGRTIDNLTELPQSAWVSLVVRSGQLLPASGDTELKVGDDVLILADPACRDALEFTFGSPAVP